MINFAWAFQRPLLHEFRIKIGIEAMLVVKEFLITKQW